MNISRTGLIETIKTTKNFWQAAKLMHSKHKRRIIFRNGLSIELSFQEYLRVRKLIASGCKVEKLNDTQLTVRGRNFEIKCSSELWGVLANLQKEVKIKRFGQIDRDTFKVETDKLILIGNLEMLHALIEINRGFYSCECLDKVVLDVGGFQGETGAYFSSLGAKKVIIYEPVAMHQRIVETNIALNNVNAELHQEGIGNMNGYQSISYENYGLKFGLVNGTKSVEIRIRNIVDVIKESQPDIAKFDCEGAEIALLQVPISILRTVSYYMIEVHSSKIKEAINTKFNASGFKPTKNFKNTCEQTSIIHFARNS